MWFFFLSLLQSVLRASTNTASGTTSVSRVRRTAKRPTRGCPSAGATPDTTGRPKIRNRYRARVSIILYCTLTTIHAYIVRAHAHTNATSCSFWTYIVIYYYEIIIKVYSGTSPGETSCGFDVKAVSILLYLYVFVLICVVFEDDILRRATARFFVW